MVHRYKKAVASIAGLGLLGVGGSARAEFTPGNIVVVQVGDGSTAFDSNFLAQAVRLAVYNATTGALVGTHALPSSGGGAFALTGRSDEHDGHLNLSTDGKYLTLGGYRATPGSAYPAAQSAASVPRVVARVDGAFNADTSTTLGNSYNGSVATPVTITGAVSSNGQQFWTGGGNEATGSGGLRYVSALGPSPTVNVSRTQTGANADSMRGLRMVGGQVYLSTASQGSFTNRGTYQMTIGGGLPVATTATASTATPIIVNKEGSTLDLFNNPDPDGKGKFHPKADAVFVDVNNDGFAETVYSTGGKEEFEKWTITGGSWTRTDLGFLLSGDEINAMDYTISDGKVNLFMSTDAGVYKLVDAGGMGGFSSSQLAPPDFENKKYFTDPYFITATGGTQFRGLAAVPEPASATIAGVAAAGLLLARRRRV